MKKIMYTVLAASALVACNNEETLLVPQSNAIEFAGAFVEKATRANAVNPSTTTGNIDNFEVWAYMDQPSGFVFGGENVVKSDLGWTYQNTQYWMPGHTYYFAAISPTESENVESTLTTDDGAAQWGLGAIAFENENGTEDLLYARTTMTTSNNINVAPESVKLQFQHLLSKVKFTFTNGFTTENINVNVSKIKMTAPKSATIDLAQQDFSKAWVLNNDKFELEFGETSTLTLAAPTSECTTELFTIPATEDYVYTVTFDVQVIVGDQEGLAVTKKATIAGQAFEMGKAYNLKAEVNPENLGLSEIVFEVEVEEWDTPIDVESVAGTPISNIDELTAFLAAANAGQNDGSCVFVRDIEGDVTIDQQEGVNIVINGNDKKFKGSMTVNGQSSTTLNKSLVIKNVNFETTETGAMDFISSGTDAVRYARNVTIENCTFTAPVGEDVDVVAIRFRQAYNVVMKDCAMFGGHSFAQFTSHSGADLYFENITVEEAGRGINLGNAVNCDVDFVNCNINATNSDGYGIRVDATQAHTMNVSGSTIQAYEPIVLRKAKEAFTFNIESTTLTTNGDYQIVVTGQIPTLKGVDGYTVCTPVSTVDSFKAALNAESVNVVTLDSDLDVTSTSTPWVNIARKVTIDTEGNTLKVGNAGNYGLFCNAGSEVTLNDANILSAGGAIVVRDGAELTIYDGSVAIESSSTSQRYIIYALGAGTEITINGGTYSFEAYKKRGYGYIADGAVLKVTGGTFGAASNHPTNPTAPFIADGGEVIISGGTFGFDPSAWVATGYKAVANGSTWTVVAE